MTTDLATTLLTALLSLPGTGLADDPAYARTVAVAIDNASGGDRRLASALVSLGFHESRFLARIQLGQCRGPFRSTDGRLQPAECDGYIHTDGTVRFRSRSAWQLQRHAAASKEEWIATTGLEFENVSTAANVAARVLRRGLARCRTLDGAIAMYGTGAVCTWKGAWRRARLAEQIEKRLTDAR